MCQGLYWVCVFWMCFCVKKEGKLHFSSPPISSAPFSVCFPPLYHLKPPQCVGCCKVLSWQGPLEVPLSIFVFVSDLQISTSYAVPTLSFSTMVLTILQTWFLDILWCFCWFCSHLRLAYLKADQPHTLPVELRS